MIKQVIFSLVFAKASVRALSLQLKTKEITAEDEYNAVLCASQPLKEDEDYGWDDVVTRLWWDLEGDESTVEMYALYDMRD